VTSISNCLRSMSSTKSASVAIGRSSPQLNFRLDFDREDQVEGVMIPTLPSPGWSGLPNSTFRVLKVGEADWVRTEETLVRNVVLDKVMRKDPLSPSTETWRTGFTFLPADELNPTINLALTKQISSNKS
jgi:hypothetical protein